MQTVDLIARKRDGGTLSTTEIEWLIAGYASGTIPDYQMAAWAMAVVLRGMDIRETTDLTMAMARSGTMLDLHDLAPVIVDKHSTGGVGDKTTLLVMPLVAAAGLTVAKMSGRGLGFTGGTIDKLESIPGMCTELSIDTFRQVVRETGLAIAAQTADMAPADKRLYALRDVTATVESIPLIAASIMSKKLAAGTDCIVLDVKYGSGAFARTPEQAQMLARTMVGIGQQSGRCVTAVISSMEQPLGFAIGNALEIREIVAALRGAPPPDLWQLCEVLGTHLLLLAGKATSSAEAVEMLRHAHATGAAWQKFRQMVACQGGDAAALDTPQRLPQARAVVPLPSLRTGTIQAIETRTLGMVVNSLGCGRMQKEDVIDPAVGIVLNAKIGDRVEVGAPLLHIHAASEANAEAVILQLQQAYTIADAPVTPPSLVLEVITE